MTINARLKSLFVLPAMGLAALLVFAALVMLALSPGYRLPWLGAALAAAALPMVVVGFLLRPSARTSEFLPAHLLLGIVGLLLAARGMYSNFVTSWELYREFGGAVLSAINPTESNAPGLVALLGMLLFLLYLFWYSRFGRYPDARLGVGSPLPEFALTDIDGNTVQSTDFLGAPAVFLFFRGNWCPLCMAQIDELVERYQVLQELGVTVCLISPQHDHQTRKLAEQKNVEFRYFVDRDNEAAQTLGIAIKNGVPLGVPGGYPADTVMPTLFVTSPGGTIVFSDQTDNYRVRPEPDVFLAILRRSRALEA